MEQVTFERKTCYNMHCFSCNQTIKKGEYITQCLESDGMELRTKPYTGSRWVHANCLPKDILTMKYIHVLDEAINNYPDMMYEDIESMVEKYDYWIHQSSDVGNTSCYHEEDASDDEEDASHDEEDASDDEEHASDDEEDTSHNDNTTFTVKENKPTERFEFAKSNRSKCVICHEFIGKNEKRVGRLNLKYGTYGSFKHLDCWDNEDPILPANMCYNIEDDEINIELLEMKKKLEELMQWSNYKASEEEKIEMAKEMCEEKKRFDKIVDETIEMLKSRPVNSNVVTY